MLLLVRFGVLKLVGILLLLVQFGVLKLVRILVIGWLVNCVVYSCSVYFWLVWLDGLCENWPPTAAPTSSATSPAPAPLVAGEDCRKGQT